MSFDHTVYVRTKRRSTRAVRTAAKIVCARHEGLTLAPLEEWEDEDELLIDGLGGPITVTPYDFGLMFDISTTTGAPRNRFVELGDLVEEIAENLGTLLDEDEALELIEAEESGTGAKSKSKEPAPPKPDTAGPTGERVEIVLRSISGHEVHRSATSVAAFEAQHLPTGGLSSTRLDPRVPAVLYDEGRRTLRANWLELTQYGSDEKVVARYDYELDVTGRIVASHED